MQLILEILNQTEEFLSNYIKLSICFEWMETADHEIPYSYYYNNSIIIDVMVIPEVDVRSSSVDIQMILSYNILYTVNIKATLCGSIVYWSVLNVTYGV